jgi:hypothetical protein
MNENEAGDTPSASGRTVKEQQALAMHQLFEDQKILADARCVERRIERSNAIPQVHATILPPQANAYSAALSDQPMRE